MESSRQVRLLAALSGLLLLRRYPRHSHNEVHHNQHHQININKLRPIPYPERDHLPLYKILQDSLGRYLPSNLRSLRDLQRRPIRDLESRRGKRLLAALPQLLLLHRRTRDADHALQHQH